MTLLPWLIFLFLLLPVAEIYVLIRVGSVIGAIPTIFLVVFTAVLGALLLRVQGLSTLRRVQLSLAQGQLPALELMEGMAIAVGGALLLTPGFITDTLGFLTLIPPLRRAAIRWFLARRGAVHGAPPPGGTGGGSGPRTIEGEFQRVDERRDRRRDGS